MKKSIFIFIFICLIAGLNAQKAPVKFGSFLTEELTMKEYAPDKVAEAVVLSDIGRSYFADGPDGFEIVFEKTTRIKILTEAGIKWATVEIPFYHEGDIFEKVFEIDGNTYNLDNGTVRVTKLNPATVFTEKINNSWSNTKFTMPEVHAGSVIEFKYKINSQYLFNLRNWEFQSRIPTIYSEYIVNLIPFYSYSWLLQGAGKFTAHESHEDTSRKRYYGSQEYTENVERFLMTDVPAFRDEEYITSINDYIIKLDFQMAKIYYPGGGTKDIITTWPALVDELIRHDDVGKFVSKCQKIAPKILSNDSLQKGSVDTKFDYIMSFVKRNFRWNKMNSYYASKSPDKLIKDKTGNCADLNLFTIGLLNAAGIEAYPVLISIRDNGRIKYDYPFLHFFDYVIICAKIDNKSILTDATEPLCMNDRVPSKCINDKGLVISKGPVEWISLQCTTPSEQNSDFIIDPRDNGDGSKMTTSLTDYLAFSYRKSYGASDTLLKAAYVKSGYEPGNLKLSISNAWDTKKPYAYECSFGNTAETINNKIYIAPFLSESYTSNPLTQGSRTYPVDIIYPVRKTYSSTITVPDGYSVEFLPAESKVSNDIFDLAYNASSDGKKVNVNFSYTFKSSVYAPVNYIKIKYYFAEIVKKANEKIVLVKN